VSALLLLAFVTTWYAGLARVDLSVASSVLVVAFPITWAMGALAGRAPLALPQALGAAAIVFGVVIVVGAAALRDAWREVLAVLRARLARGA
jgi:drug/metabolite transporter (DMT)-like permease